MRRATVITTALCLLGVVFSAQSSGQASRIFDRTLLCQTGLQAGQREIYPFATSGFRFVGDPGRWQRLADVRVSSPQHASGSPEDGGVSAMLRAGSPQPPLDQPYSSESTFWLGTDRCQATRTSVPLSPRGLGGGIANRFGENFECYPPKRVLIRVRAVFSSPTAPKRRGAGLASSVTVKEGRLAVRTQTGKPLVYAEALESGRARLFVAGSCLRP